MILASHLGIMICTSFLGSLPVIHHKFFDLKTKCTCYSRDVVHWWDAWHQFRYLFVLFPGCLPHCRCTICQRMKLAWKSANLKSTKCRIKILKYSVLAPTVWEQWVKYAIEIYVLFQPVHRSSNIILAWSLLFEVSISQPDTINGYQIACEYSYLLLVTLLRPAR